MRRVMMTVVGLVGLSLLLCGSGEVVAQADTAQDTQNVVNGDTTDSRVQGTPPVGAQVGSSTGATSGTTASAPAAVGADAGSAELRQSVLQLQGEVAQLRQELAQVRAELANVTRNTGVGGAGQGGAGGAGQASVAPSATQPGRAETQDAARHWTATSNPVTGGTTGQGSAPRGDTNTAQGTTAPGTAAGGSSTSGDARVDAIYTGTVRSVSAGRLVLLDEAGQPFTIELSDRTRVLQNGQRISVDQLKQGTRVRATVELPSGHNQAKEITTLPAR